MSKEDPSCYTYCECCGKKIYYDPGFHLINGKKYCTTCFKKYKYKNKKIRPINH